MEGARLLASSFSAHGLAQQQQQQQQQQVRAAADAGHTEDLEHCRPRDAVKLLLRQAKPTVEGSQAVCQQLQQDEV
jgi:hypothetical protein